MDTFPQLTPYIRVAMDQYCPAGFYLRKRVIFDHYLACIADGTLLVELNGKKIKLEVGDFILVQPGEEHILSCLKDVPTHLPHLHFDFFTLPDAADVFVSFKLESELRGFESLFRKPIREEMKDLLFTSVIKPLNYEEPLECLMKIISLQGQISTVARLEQRGHFFRLIALLLQACQVGETFRNPRHLRAMEEIMDVIRNQYCEPLTLESMAEAVHLSPSHFSHLFKQYYQTSPMQFLRNYRIEQVKKQLLTSDKSLTLIADCCGFSSIHVLSRVFKEVTGQNPTRFLAGTQNSKI
jgi:AraC-like DNA-binding protein